MNPDRVQVRTVARKGGKGGNQSQHQPTEADNTLRSRSTARILEVLSEGVIDGLATGDMQSVFLDKTPIQNPDGTTNFEVPQAYFREGLPDQDPVPGFPAAEAEFAVGVEMQYAVPVVRRLSAGLSAVRYKVRVSALYWQEQDGDVSAVWVDYTMEMRVGTSSAWVQMVAEQIFGKTMSPYERAVRVDIPVTDEVVDIRLTRTTPPPADSTIQNQIYFSTYTEIIDVNLKYDDTAIAAMVVDSQFFPNIPLRGYLLRGIVVQVPSNYDAEARTYAGDWDGTFVPAWTNNPAWILYDLLTNRRYGIGRDIDADAVDKWSFYEAAQYNDQPVPDGHPEGNTEPRFTCNCVINTRQDALIVLSAVASSMRAVVYYAAGTVFLVQDREQTTPERLFGPANAESGIFDYTGTDYRSMFTAVPVTWIDPSDNYEASVELVQDQDLVARQGYRPKDNAEVAFGCTSRGQAIRWGRWLIFTAQHETEFVSFRTGLENADVRPGQLIAINDPSRAGVRMAGRTLEQPAPDQLKFDAPAHGIEAGWHVYVTVGTLVTQTVVTAILAPDTVTVSGLTAAVPAASMWLAGSATVIEPTPWRVVTVKDNGGGVYEVLAAQYHPSKYSYVDYGVYIEPPPYSTIPTGPLLGPTTPNVREYIYLDASGTPQAGAVISWLASPDPRVAFYLVELQGPAADYRRYDNVNTVSVDVPRMRQGEWILSLVAIDNLGRRSPVLRVVFNTIGLSAKPLPPPALYIQPQGDILHLQWVQSTELDVSYWWIKWSPVADEGARWEEATTIAARIDRQTTTMNTPYRAGTYFIKAVDSLGQESETATSAVVDPQDRETTVLVHIVEQPTWLGTRGIWELDAPELILLPPPEAEPVPTGVYPGERALALNATPTRVEPYGFANAFDAGAALQFSMTALFRGRGTLADDDVMANWIPLAAADPLARSTSGNWDAHIEASTSLDAIAYGDWFLLKMATVTARAARFRMVGSIYDIETTLKAAQAEVTIEAPKRSETGNSAVVGAGGTVSIAFAVPFAATPNVQITAASLAAGGNVRVSAATRDGFTVEHRNAAGTLAPGASFDWFAQGYGVH